MKSTIIKPVIERKGAGSPMYYRALEYGMYDRESDENVRQQVIRLSRENYGVKPEEVGAEEAKIKTPSKPTGKTNKKKSSKLSEIKQVIN